MSVPSYTYEPKQPAVDWDENIRTSYGTGWILFSVFVVLILFIIVFIMLVVRFFSQLFRVERAPLRKPADTAKHPNPVKLVWNTLWDEPMPPGNFRSQRGIHSMSTRQAMDYETESIYMDTVPMM